MNWPICRACGATTKAWWTAFMACSSTGPTTCGRSRTASTRNLRVASDARQADMVRRKVLRTSQDHPEATVYLELLVWVFNQQRDFMSAMAHVRALDERNGEGGRLMELARGGGQEWRSGDRLRVLRPRFGPGKTSPPLHAQARQAMLGVLTEQVTGQFPSTPPPPWTLPINTAPPARPWENSRKTAGLMADWAKLLAFHLDDATCRSDPPRPLWTCLVCPSTSEVDQTGPWRHACVPR